jgi:hypothetical protein
VELVVVEFVDFTSLSDSYPLLFIVELLRILMFLASPMGSFIESFFNTYFYPIIIWGPPAFNLVKVELKLLEDVLLESDISV